jgi:hypothetical protein
MPAKNKKKSVKSITPLMNAEMVDRCLDDMMHPSDSNVNAILGSVSEVMRSGLELTKLIVECEQKQDIKLDRKEIYKIYSESIETIGKTVSEF